VITHTLGRYGYALLCINSAKGTLTSNVHTSHVSRSVYTTSLAQPSHGLVFLTTSRQSVFRYTIVQISCIEMSRYKLIQTAKSKFVSRQPTWQSCASSPWLQLNWALSERPLDSFPAFYWTQRFITAFTRAFHLSLSWARPIQSTSPSSHLSKISPNIIHSPTSWSSQRSLSFWLSHQ
jgi:hypothetical protein